MPASVSEHALNLCGVQTRAASTPVMVMDVHVHRYHYGQHGLPLARCGVINWENVPVLREGGGS